MKGTYYYCYYLQLQLSFQIYNIHDFAKALVSSNMVRPYNFSLSVLRNFRNFYVISETQ
jgi:hypothetical protein